MTEPHDLPLALSAEAPFAAPGAWLSPRVPGSRRRLAAIAVVALLAILAGLLLVAIYRAATGEDAPLAASSADGRAGGFSLTAAQFARAPGQNAAAIVAETASDSGDKALSPEAARAANARVPVTLSPGPSAYPLLLPLSGDGRDYAHALDCLTSAIYYEAANEPLEGQRAVAQVVLNRVRHLAYPHSICAVVYQGAERRTGCQFSFACDGARGRAPVLALWNRARYVAGAALGGYVYRPVGLATHYHADYVVPYWAPTLVKQKVIGRHIFYRWPGAWGRASAFAARYEGREPDNAPQSSLFAAREDLQAIAEAPVPTTDPATEFSAARPVLMGSREALPAVTGAAAPSPAPARTFLSAPAGRPGRAPTGAPTSPARSVTGGVLAQTASAPIAPPPARGQE